MGRSMQLLCLFPPKCIDNCWVIAAQLLHLPLVFTSSRLHDHTSQLKLSWDDQCNFSIWFVFVLTGVHRELQGSSRSTLVSLPQTTGSLKLFLLFVIYFPIDFKQSFQRFFTITIITMTRNRQRKGYGL